MSWSRLEVEVPTEAIEQMVTSPTYNEAFQYLKGGTGDRFRDIPSNPKTFKLRSSKEWQGYKPELKIFKKLWY